MEAKIFGRTKEGKTIYQYKIQQGKMSAVITEYGTAVLSLMVPAADGKLQDVVLGYDTLQEYEEKNYIIGGTVGRIANRISGAAVELNRKRYLLEKNDGENFRDGGNCGFHKRIWQKKSGESEDSESEITFFLESPDGDQGFPGNIHMEATYSLRDDMAFVIEYHVISDQDTLLNLTNRSYFNLHGQENGDILDHILQIYSTMYMPLRGYDRIPSGITANIVCTPFDFGCPKKIGRDLYKEDIQIKYGNGYDHNYVIAMNKGAMKTVANVRSEKTGIGMEVRTNLPGLQFSSGNELGIQKGKGGMIYYDHSGFTLEPQYWPDSINIEGFLPYVLRKGMPWNSKTVYRFYHL